jgi:RNA polymerase sigma factor, sigma-70 family
MDAVARLLDEDEYDDEVIVAAILRSEEGAFERLMRRHNRRLYRAARSILQNEVEAEEAIQEAYWKAYQALARFKFDARLSTWLTRIVINEALGRMRRSRRRENWVESYDPMNIEQLAVMGDARVSRDLGPDALAWRAEIRTLIEKHLDSLPEAYRVIFMLRAVEEMSAPEIAEVLGIPETTVRTRYFRAKGLMRKALADDIDAHAAEAFSFDGLRCDRIVMNVLARFGR